MGIWTKVLKEKMFPIRKQSISGESINDSNVVDMPRKQKKSTTENLVAKSALMNLGIFAGASNIAKKVWWLTASIHY